MTLWQLITQIYWTICIPCLLQGTQPFQCNKFCGQTFMFLSERMTSMKRDPLNQLPLDLQLPAVLSQPNVAFHLLPLSGGAPKASSAPKASNPKKKSRSPRRQPPVKGKGGPKGRSGKSRGPNIPAGFINKALDWRLHRNNACPGRTISQMDAAKFKRHSFVC